MANKTELQQFSYEVERAYYAHPTAQLRDYTWLDAYYRGLSSDYPKFFNDCRVLDLGAGECLHGRFVSDRCRPSVYVNLDLFANRMELASANNRFEQVCFVVGDCFRLPFADASFDTVWGSGILVRLRPLEPVAEEIRRVLSRGGAYIGVEPNFQCVAVRLRRARTENKNDWPILARNVRASFESAGMVVSFKYFWRKITWLKHSLLSPTLGIVARAK